MSMPLYPSVGAWSDSGEKDGFAFVGELFHQDRLQHIYGNYNRDMFAAHPVVIFPSLDAPARYLIDVDLYVYVTKRTYKPSKLPETVGKKIQWHGGGRLAKLNDILFKVQHAIRAHRYDENNTLELLSVVFAGVNDFVGLDISRNIAGEIAQLDVLTPAHATVDIACPPAKTSYVRVCR